jgi:hypothetical protein
MLNFLLSHFSYTAIFLWLANGFVWGLIFSLYTNNKQKKYNVNQPLLSLGDLLYIILIATPQGYLSAAWTLIWILGNYLSDSQILKKPVIK